MQQNRSRRVFLKRLASAGALSLAGGNIFSGMLHAGTAVLGPRRRNPNPYVTADGRPLLVIVSGTDFGEMLRTGLERLGGLGKVTGNVRNVLIKPNLNAVDRYPAISSAQSILTLAQEVAGNTPGLVTVGDAGYHDSSRVYQHIDLEETLRGSGSEHVFFSETYTVRRAPVIKWTDYKVAAPPKPDILVYAHAYDAPVIINFACLKRHFLANMSAAIKNNVGCVAASGAKMSRSYLHELKGDNLLAEVAEIAAVINPELTIVDIRSALIGNGPFSNSPGARVLDGVGMLVMSGDMIAVDLYCSMLLSGLDRAFSPRSIEPMLEHAHALGCGVKDLSQVEILEPSTSMQESGTVVAPDGYELYQNYPNPFNASTHIGFRIGEQSHVTLSIYDALGRKVMTLVDRQMAPGSHGSDFDGSGFPSGVYFCQLRVGPRISSKKMTLLR